MATENQDQNAAAPAHHSPQLGDNKGIKFRIQTGSQKWDCTLQDRGTYERKQTNRTPSTDSVETTGSGSSNKSASTS